MSDEKDNDKKYIPTQESSDDTSNWDNKESVDPEGNRYIRTSDEN